MTKRISLLILSTLALLYLTSATALGQTCRQGLEWRMSYTAAWGKGKPVISLIEPYSPAQYAGLRVGDIIDSINGKSTQGLSTDQVAELLHSTSTVQLLALSSWGRSSRRVLLGRECRPQRAIAERELAELFALYSPEDAGLRHLRYPYRYEQSNSFDLTNASSFAFAPSNSATDAVDTPINAELRRLLLSKGLRERTHPDLIISTYYQLEPSTPSDASAQYVWRFDPQDRGLRLLPVADTVAAQYRVTLGIQIQDAATRAIVWSCEANEGLSSAMSIVDYALYNLEVMLTQFPMVLRHESPSIEAHTLRYYYTGLIYAHDDLARIVDIEDGSPAMRAGLRPGDRIKAIDGRPMEQGGSDAVLASYYQLMERTERYRATSLPILSMPTSGQMAFPWSLDQSANIAEALDRSRSAAALSYLFAFRPYIKASGSPSLTFEIERSGHDYTVRVEPQLRKESTISPL